MSFPPDYDLNQLGPPELNGFGEDEPLPELQEIDYNVDLEDDEEERLAARLVAELDAYESATDKRRSNLRQWRDDWEVYPSAEGDEHGPVEGASNVTSDATRRTCDNHHTRLNQQILFNDPPMTAVARKREVVPRVRQIEEALTAIMDEADWQVPADEVHAELPVAGNTFLKITYEVEREWRPTIDVDVDKEAAEQLVLAGVDPATAAFDSLARDAKGRIKRKVGFEEVTTYQGVRFTVIPWEHGVVLPASVTDWQKAYGIGEQMVLTGEELRQGAREGKYRQDAVDDLLHKESDAPDQERIDQWDRQGIEAHARPSSAGSYTSEGDPVEALYREYTVHELCYRYPVKGKKGAMAWLRVTFHKESRTFLRLQWLPYEHGKPCYVMFGYLPRPGQLYSAGVAELMTCYQDADTALINIFLDHLNYIVNVHGNLAVDERAGFDPEKFVQRLGQPLEFERLEGVMPLSVPGMPADAYNLLQIGKERIELLTRSSNPSLGRNTDANRTATEVSVVSSANAMQFEDSGARVARTWALAWDQVRHLVAQYGEGGEVEYRVTARPATTISKEEVFPPAQQAAMPGMEAAVPGMQPPGMPGMDPAAAQPAMPGETEFRTISSEDLKSAIDLVPTGLASLADMQSRMQQATLMAQFVLGLPIAAQVPEVQLILMDFYLQTLRVPVRDQLLQAVRQALIAQAQAQAAMMGAQAQDANAEAAVIEAAAAAAEAEAGGGQFTPQGIPEPAGAGRQPAGAI